MVDKTDRKRNLFSDENTFAFQMAAQNFQFQDRCSKILLFRWPLMKWLLETLTFQMAAQNCRKRKLGQIDELAERLQAARRAQDLIRQEHSK